MTPQEIQSALELALATALPTTPTAWPNVAFDPATDAVDGDGNKVLWIRPTNKPAVSSTASFQEDKDVGVFIVQVFGPDGTGLGDVNAAAAMIESTFRRKELSGVVCDVPYINDVGPDGSGWYQMNIIIPWSAYTTV